MKTTEINRIKRVEDLPEVLTMPLVARVLGCSLNTAYGLLNLHDFPRAVVGQRVYIDKVKFLSWVESQGKKKVGF